MVDAVAVHGESPHNIGPRSVFTPLLFPALLFVWLITLDLTLTIRDNIVLEKSAESKSGVYGDFYPNWCASRGQPV